MSEKVKPWHQDSRKPKHHGDQHPKSRRVSPLRSGSSKKIVPLRTSNVSNDFPYCDDDDDLENWNQ